ncbi:MAG: T9SS type A sorting domain-containing protein [Calditrichaeota bacterium]|nr:T9SS type A sorting domain-containing protein [Calditrichota bacterium]
MKYFSAILKTSITFLILLNSFFKPAFGQTDSTLFIKGADVSFIPQIEDLGGQYLREGINTDPLYIFKENGFNYIRLKLWHTPQENYNSLPRILEMAQRIKDHQLKFLLNFHYADTWADPGHQPKPAAWADLSFTDLTDSLYLYTRNVIAALDNQNTLPDMVQIGNEINSGMLWNDGKVGGEFNTPTQWENLASLINAGITGVRDGSLQGDSIKIMIHRAGAEDYNANKWFFDNLRNENVEFDIIGLSYYPWWHGDMDEVKSTLNKLVTRYGKDLIIAETAYPWTLDWYDSKNNIVGSSAQLHDGYPATVTGQANFLRDLMQIIGNVSEDKGKGVFYWAPEYISVQPLGSPWENLALFDFEGNVLESMAVFKELPDSLLPINVTLKINTATNWDTLQENHFVQLRGEIKGTSFGVLPDGKKVTWDSSSELVLENIGGDYWQASFQMYPEDELSYKIWTGLDKNTGTHLRGGWEGAITAFNGSTTNRRNLVAGFSDTTINIQFYNSSPETKTQYWKPYNISEDSIAVYFRVNMNNAVLSGRFNPDNHGPLAVRGDSLNSGGVLSWEKSKLILSREENSVNDGSFWSGTGYFSKSDLASNAKLSYQFYIENSDDDGWENVSARELVFSENILSANDTTLHWVYFDKATISSLKSATEFLPKDIRLLQNYPNPFNPRTNIEYEINVTTQVRLVILNVLGKEVRLLENTYKRAGNYSTTWDGKNNSGQYLGSGIYFIQLQTDTHSQLKKALLLK